VWRESDKRNAFGITSKMILLPEIASSFVLAFHWPNNGDFSRMSGQFSPTALVDMARQSQNYNQPKNVAGREGKTRPDPQRPRRFRRQLHKAGGAPLASLSRSQVASRLAYVPQAHVAAFPYTVREVVTMGRLPKRSLLSYPSEHDGEIVRDVLDQLRILHLADRVYSEISGGERQLTLVARALAQESPILILDEPMANLDFGYQGVRHHRARAK
jgi:ABC-type sugar transport system ATPase subunit